ncbi:MAG: polysaccharide pyruvyl transferase family protein [Bacteroides sp.]|nr:polysaccharide pyruvyl transferase family protein [Bacteroides sp.]
MRIGILSMQRVINYGSYLQAFALRQLLLRHGVDEVGFIDIKEGRHLRGNETSGTRYALRRLRALAKVIISGRLFAKRRTLAFMGNVRNVIMSAWNELGIKDNNNDDNYDLAIIGSDEVFHCCQPSSWGYTPQLYGDIPEAKRVVSYAGSFGATKYEDLLRHGIGDEIAGNLKRLSHISVRDENSRSIVERLTGRNPLIHIDPVLAYGFKNELEHCGSVDESNYILVYSYPDRINSPKEIKAITSYAREHNKKLISVMSRYDWCDRAIIPTPLRLLAWFKHADAVITETFHGTIFSIITQRQFVTIARKSSIPKLTSMLKPYGLNDRILRSPDDITKVFSDTVDYSAVNTRLNALRKETDEYIDLILKG